MKFVKNKKHGVINEVSDAQFEYLMKGGEYEEYKPKKKGRPKKEDAEPEVSED
jgi:hypothetical protein